MATTRPLILGELPAELQAALERSWPGQPEAQRRALLAPSWLGGRGLWPHGLWPWQPAWRWWRPQAARNARAGCETWFTSPVEDVRGAPRDARLFDPDQPFFETPWTYTAAPLRSPTPHAFSDAEFWYLLQQLCGGDLPQATALAHDWTHGLERDDALRSRGRRSRWLVDAQYRLLMSACGNFS